MGASYSGGPHPTIDPNPVALRPEQSVRLMGLMHSKSTLTWADVVQHPTIDFKTCVEQGLTPMSLYRMQPSLQEWLRHSRCTVKVFHSSASGHFRLAV